MIEGPSAATGVCANGIALQRGSDWRTTMTMISTAAGRPGNTAASSGIVRWFGRGACALAAYWERRAAIRALLQRNDRELRDIGIVRSQIELVVCGGLSADMQRGRQAGLRA